MTQYQLLNSYSAVVSLVVTNYPLVGGLTITGPASPQIKDEPLACVFTFNNTGGGDGTILFTLKNQAGGTLGTVNVLVGAGQVSATGSIAFTMPNSDIILTVTSNYGGTASKTIVVVLEIGTTLTLSLSPSPVKVGDTVTASGYLSRNDNPQNYSGVSGATVRLLKSDNTLIASGTAGATGGYSITFPAPATAGTYSYKSYFPGSAVLSASLSNAVGFTLEGAVDPGILPWIILGGIALVLLSDEKRKVKH